MVAHEAYPMPTGFLEDLAARFEQEGLDSMLGPTGMHCSAARRTGPVLATCLSSIVRLPGEMHVQAPRLTVKLCSSMALILLSRQRRSQALPW